MSEGTAHVSRLIPRGPAVLRPGDVGAEAAVTLERLVGGDPVALGSLLAEVEPLRADGGATIVTDAAAETVRFLAVLAVLEEREPMPDYDLDDPSLKWHAKKGVKAVPNPPSIVTGPTPRAGGAA